MSRAQRAVGGEDQVVVVELLAAACARPMPVWSSTRSCGVKRAASCFQLKTSDRGTTTSDGGRRLRLPRRAARGALQQGEHLHGLAQAHVVGQAAAEAELAEEVEPAQALALVGAELALEAAGGSAGSTPSNRAARRGAC